MSQHNNCNVEVTNDDKREGQKENDESGTEMFEEGNGEL